MLGREIQAQLLIEPPLKKTLLFRGTRHTALERFGLPGIKQSKQHRRGSSCNILNWRVRDRNGSPERSEDYSGEPDPKGHALFWVKFEGAGAERSSTYEQIGDFLPGGVAGQGGEISGVSVNCSHESIPGSIAAYSRYGRVQDGQDGYGYAELFRLPDAF